MVILCNPNKKFYLLKLDRFSDFVGHYDKISTKSFAVLFLNNLAISEKEIDTLATDLMDRGLALMLAWGKDTDDIEQIFDSVGVAKYMEQDDETWLNMLTASNKHEPFDESLAAFTHIDPNEQYKDCNTYILVIIGKKKWQAQIEKQVKTYFQYIEKELEYF